MLGLSGAVVRRHLDSLVEAGLASATSRPPFGPSPEPRRGRPARTFALTDRGRHAFDVAYDDLAISALRFLAGSAEPSAASPDPVAGFAESRADEWADRHRDRFTGTESVHDRVSILADLLNEEGYSATVVGSPGAAALQICQHHCPVSHVAGEFPQLCEAETHAFERLLGTHALRLATIAHGDGVCTTLVPLTSVSVDGAGALLQDDSVSLEMHEAHPATTHTPSRRRTLA